MPECVQGAYSSRASHLQSVQNLLRPCGHTRGGSIFAINHISVWKNLRAFSIQSSGVGSLTTGNSIPLRCGRYTGMSTTRYVPGSCGNTVGYVDTKCGPACSCRELQSRTRLCSPIGALEGSARLSDGSGVSREAHAPFCERPKVQFLRPTLHVLVRACGAAAAQRAVPTGPLR